MLDLKLSLQRDSYLPDGRTLMQFDAGRFDFLLAVQEYIETKQNKNITPPLESLHEQVPLTTQWASGESLNHYSAYLSEASQNLVDTYYRFIKYMSQEMVDYDFVFEANPMLRVHFPVKLPDRFRSNEGKILAYHSDTLLDSPFEEINCWLPLTSCEGNASLQIADLINSKIILDEFCNGIDYDSERYLSGRMEFFHKLNNDKQFQMRVIDACQSLAIDYGNILLFDSRTIHGTAENDTDKTRVSIDFRIIPIEQYNEINASYHQSGNSIPSFEGQPIMKGGFYHEQSAREL